MQQMIKLFLTIIAIANLNLTTLSAQENEQTTFIDTLILYSTAVKNHYHDEPEIRIEHLIEVTNTIFTQSHLNIKINPVKLLTYTMETNASASTVITTLQADSNVSKLRDQYGADLVLIYRMRKNNGNCGIAYINDGRSAYSFANVSIDCSDHYTAHEIGHTMGLYHSTKENPEVGYPRGYGIDYEFSTIMTYASHYNGKLIQKFSSPKLECYGYPCGVKEGELHEADAVKAILENAPIIAQFKPTKTIISAETLKQAEAQYLYYKKEFEDAKIKLEELYNIYLEAQEQYNKALLESKRVMTKFQSTKALYQKLQKEYKETKDKSVYIAAKEKYNNISQTLNKNLFSNTYSLEVKKNKLEMTYKTYKNSVYKALKVEYAKAKSYYEELLSLYVK